MTTFGPQNLPKRPQIDQNRPKSTRGRSNHRILRGFNVEAHATLERNDHLASQTRTRLEQKTSLSSKFDTRLVRNARFQRPRASSWCPPGPQNREPGPWFFRRATNVPFWTILDPDVLKNWIKSSSFTIRTKSDARHSRTE